MRISAVLTLFVLTYLFDIHVCDKYAIGHQLAYNATKSFALYFKLKHIKFDLPDFVFGKHVIPVVNKCKYLRITRRVSRGGGARGLGPPPLDIGH